MITLDICTVLRLYVTIRLRQIFLVEKVVLAFALVDES